MYLKGHFVVTYITSYVIFVPMDVNAYTAGFAMRMGNSKFADDETRFIAFRVLMHYAPRESLKKLMRLIDDYDERYINRSLLRRDPVGSIQNNDKP
jgi:hypothetical protein